MSYDKRCDQPLFRRLFRTTEVFWELHHVGDFVTEVIDVASFQHPNGAGIDWNAVKNAGVSGVVVKVTEGTNYVNPYAAADLSNATTAGLTTAGYLFFHPSVDPIAQADYYLANGGSALAGVAIDAEVSDSVGWAAIATDVQRCHDYLALQHGKNVLLYVNVSWSDALGDENWNWEIWLADPSNPSPSRACVLWQYTSNSVPGIQGSVDRDRWVGSADQYNAFFGVAAPAPAPTPPAPTPVPGGIPVMRLDTSFTTDANGYASWDVTLPTGKTHLDVVSVIVDAGSPYDDGKWHTAQVSVDYQEVGDTTPNVARLIAKSDTPNHFFTARVWITD